MATTVTEPTTTRRTRGDTEFSRDVAARLATLRQEYALGDKALQQLETFATTVVDMDKKDAKFANPTVVATMLDMLATKVRDMSGLHPEPV
jgi:hypothetical protein